MEEEEEEEEILQAEEKGEPRSATPKADLLSYICATSGEARRPVRRIYCTLAAS